jgi:hypothetical protein
VRLTYLTGNPAILMSVALAAGTDQFGTAYPAGTILPGPGDGAQYNTGARSVATTATQNITSTSAAVIGTGTGGPLLQHPVAAGVSYRVRGKIVWVQGAVAASQGIGISGPATTRCRIQFFNAGTLTSSNLVYIGQLTAMGTRIGSTAFAATATVVTDFDGWVTFSAAGTFAMTASEVTGGDTFAIASESNLDIWPAIAA